MSLGIEEAGFSVVAAADYDSDSIETHTHNIPCLTWTGDLADPSGFISQLGSWGIDTVDLLAGGADKGMYFIWDFTQLNVRPHSRVGLLKYKTAPKCSLPGPFRHSGVGRNPGAVGPVRSYNLNFTYPCQGGGGAPCQPFSRAGTSKIGNLVRSGLRQAIDSRADLWHSFFAIADRLRPRAVLFENVPDFAEAQGGALLIALVDELRSRGYAVYVEVLSAWRYRIPQHRSRLFVAGVLVVTRKTRTILGTENEARPNPPNVFQAGAASDDNFIKSYLERGRRYNPEICRSASPLP